MSDRVYLLVKYDFIDPESFSYFMGLWEEEEIEPSNETERMLVQISDKEDELKRYSDGEKEFYRTETPEGYIFYGEREVLEDIFPDTGTWGEIYEELE